MKAEKGNISIHTENLFPIIKKFLYSDHEIFLRELVSNAVDAGQKLKRLASMGEYKDELEDLKISVSIDKDAKTITVSDNGIGMTGEEIKKYINQIAFSGATEFVEKYKDADDAQQIIGHFGLGFYSAFMVSESVDIVSLSYKEGSEAAKWSCTGETEFSLEKAERDTIGTDIILHIAEDSVEFLESMRVSSILNKYCKFLPIEVEFEDKVINNPSPVWTKSPSELKDEDYLSFYKELYPMAEDPLFWIHLNVDYPFNLTGVLYFPKVQADFSMHKDKIQLYSRQVFITDEVKDVVPEFLMLLHGVIDSPDIPLNVSRSFLQSDSNVKKINAHITKKVADKLDELFKEDRKAYEDKWDSIGLFVKYGMISEEKFYDKAQDFCLFKNTAGEFATFDEYKTKVEINQKDKEGQLVYLYTTDKDKQDPYIQTALKRSYDIIDLDTVIDNHFVNALEQKLENTSLRRVDSDTIDKLINKDEKLESVLNEKEQDKLKGIYTDAISNEQASISLESLPADELPLTVTIPEFMRRMKDMSQYGGMGVMGELPETFNVSINTNHPLADKILKAKSVDKKQLLAKQAYDLALLSQNMLKGPDLTNFINRSIDLTVS